MRMSWRGCVDEMVADGVDEYAAESECERYVQMPGQATAYMLGSIQLQQLRNATQAALGDLWDPAEFHNVILRWGAMNMDELTALMGTYVMYKLDPNDADLDDAFGADIIRDEMFSRTRPTVGLGRKDEQQSGAATATTAQTNLREQRRALQKYSPTLLSHAVVA
eukprot:TRINITY_DN488_c0_g1_i2.p1 TRINITY_DN488_c0_g1~~TRINITY_DN488_c0_g1_i2.p1  ORF type:complete len:165 (-),score=38.93 TRINITY_DN488_c0_g1_i2:65-559(-)